MLFQPPPVETYDYMVLGFAVILGIMALYIMSLALRFRSLRRDLDLLEEIESKESA